MKDIGKKVLSIMLVLSMVLTGMMVFSNTETVQAASKGKGIYKGYDTYEDFVEAFGLKHGATKKSINDLSERWYDSEFDINTETFINTYYTCGEVAKKMGYIVPEGCVKILAGNGEIPYIGYKSDGTKVRIFDQSGYDVLGYNANYKDKNGKLASNMSKIPTGISVSCRSTTEGIIVNITLTYTESSYNKDEKKVKINKTTFGDLASVLSDKKYDENKDGYLSEFEIWSIRDLYTEKEIKTVKGLELLTKCKELTLANYIGSKITIKPKNIERVNILSNVKSLTVNAPNAICVSVSSAQKMDISKCTSAQYIILTIGKKAPQITYPKNKNKIEVLTFYGDGVQGNISTIDVSAFKNLKVLTIMHCGVKKISVSACKKLTYFYAYNCPSIKSVDFSKNKQLVAGNFTACDSIKTIKQPPNGKVKHNNEGSYWFGTEKYIKFLKDNNLNPYYM